MERVEELGGTIEELNSLMAQKPGRAIRVRAERQRLEQAIQVGTGHIANPPESLPISVTRY